MKFRKKNTGLIIIRIIMRLIRITRITRIATPLICR